MNKNNPPIAWILNEADIGSNALPPKIYTADEMSNELDFNIPIVPRQANDPRPERVYVEVVLQTADYLNRNKRIYSRSELKREVNGDRIQTLIAHKQLKGELGHPLDESLQRQQTIDPKLCSVIYHKVWFDYPYVKGIVSGTYNAYGEEFNNEVLSGASPEYSARSLGSVNRRRDGTAMVTNQHLITWDQVIFQSDRASYTKRVVGKDELHAKGIMTESGVILPKTENNRRLLLNEACKNDMCSPIYNEEVIRYIKEQSGNIKTIQEQFGAFFDTIKLMENGRQVSMTDKQGNLFMVNLESYIHNEIMDWCGSRF